MFTSSMRDCHCIPWDMIRNDTEYDFELCDSGGNGCFWTKMAEASEQGLSDTECYCLGDCENVKYSQYVTLKPVKRDGCNVAWNNNGLTDSLIPISLENQEALVLSKILTPMKNISDWPKLKTDLMQEYFERLCNKIQTKDQTSLELRLEGPTFMTMERSLRVTFADKLGSIGGTLGLFSGFSLLAIMELIHWICKIINSLIVSKK